MALGAEGTGCMEGGGAGGLAGDSCRGTPANIRERYHLRRLT